MSKFIPSYVVLLYELEDGIGEAVEPGVAGHQVLCRRERQPAKRLSQRIVNLAKILQLALGVEAEQDGVEDVHVDQGPRLVRVAVRLLGLVLWGMKVSVQRGEDDDLTVPDEVGDVLDGLQVVGLLGISEGLLLQSLGVVS